MSAADFAESLGANRTVTVRVKCPLDDSNAAWSLLGQEVSVEVDCDCTIKEVKSRLKAQLGMPENKQQLKHPGWGFSNMPSLAHFNVVGHAAGFGGPGARAAQELRWGVLRGHGLLLFIGVIHRRRARAASSLTLRRRRRFETVLRAWSGASASRGLSFAAVLDSRLGPSVSIESARFQIARALDLKRRDKPISN